MSTVRNISKVCIIFLVHTFMFKIVKNCLVMRFFESRVHYNLNPAMKCLLPFLFPFFVIPKLSSFYFFPSVLSFFSFFSIRGRSGKSVQRFQCVVNTTGGTTFPRFNIQGSLTNIISNCLRICSSLWFKEPLICYFFVRLNQTSLKYSHVLLLWMYLYTLSPSDTTLKQKLSQFRLDVMF